MPILARHLGHAYLGYLVCLGSNYSSLTEHGSTANSAKLGSTARGYSNRIICVNRQQVGPYRPPDPPLSARMGKYVESQKEK